MRQFLVLAVLVPILPALAQQPCCEPSPSPGCGDSACSAQVCEFDPYCCSTAWDERCAGQASVLCAPCRVSQACTPPSAQASESESCGASGNAGCPEPDAALQELILGSIITGTVWASDTFRDVDWFQITLPFSGSLSIECWSAGPVGAALVDSACPPTIFAETVDGCPARCQACLPPGTYRVAVRPLLFETLACGDPRATYSLRATLAPCAPDLPINDRCEFAEVIGEGSVQFDSREASSDPAWLPSACDEGAGLAFTHDVWFSFTAPATAIYRIGTCDAASFDARLALYDACGSDAIACNDDACPDGAASIDAGIPCGTQVLIRLGGWGHGAVGSLQVSAIDPASCPCEADLDGNGIVDAGDVAFVLLCFGDAGGPADLDRDLDVGPGDLALALLSTGPCP